MRQIQPMLSRRVFGACAICSSMGLVATEAAAQGPAPFTRDILARADVSGTGYEVVQVRVTVPPRGFIAWHTHPGFESSFILEGRGTFLAKGRADMPLEGGSSFLVPPGEPHAVRCGEATMVVAASYTVEKGKPLASPAEAPS